MANNADKRQLKLLDAFDVAASDAPDETGDQVGYQKVDDTTVLERKIIPLAIASTVSDQILMRTDVYDFNNFTVTSYTVRLGHSDAPFRESPSRNFSDIEGKQCIRDAHRALTELGGSPPPLDEIMDFCVELKKSVAASRPLQLKQGQP
jgi:hypothetical protein